MFGQVSDLYSPPIGEGYQIRNMCFSMPVAYQMIGRSSLRWCKTPARITLISAVSDTELM